MTFETTLSLRLLMEPCLMENSPVRLIPCLFSERVELLDRGLALRRHPLRVCSAVLDEQQIHLQRLMLPFRSCWRNELFMALKCFILCYLMICWIFDRKQLARYLSTLVSERISCCLLHLPSYKAFLNIPYLVTRPIRSLKFNATTLLQPHLSQLNCPQNGIPNRRWFSSPFPSSCFHCFGFSAI